jgi:hypothetical protein
MWARGVKLFTIPYRDIRAAAQQYLTPELIADTLEKVRTTPELQALITPKPRRQRRRRANLETITQTKSEPKSTGSAVQISGAE